MTARLPSLSTRDIVRAFEKAGFCVVPQRGKGSHVAMAREDCPAILTVPTRRDVSRGTLRKLIRQSGLTVDEFLALL